VYSTQSNSLQFDLCTAHNITVYSLICAQHTTNSLQFELCTAHNLTVYSLIYAQHTILVYKTHSLTKQSIKSNRQQFYLCTAHNLIIKTFKQASKNLGNIPSPAIFSPA